MGATLSFGPLLRRLRKRVGMSQRDLATVLGYSGSLISSLEKERRLPDLQAVITCFIPALGVQDDPPTAAVLIACAAAARGQQPPDPATLRQLIPNGIYQGQHRRPGALPIPPGELIGRDAELQRLSNRLRGQGG
jgi:transcriptional regulator with XRE-family HTH domain